MSEWVVLVVSLSVWSVSFEEKGRSRTREPNGIRVLVALTKTMLARLLRTTTTIKKRERGRERGRKEGRNEQRNTDDALSNGLAFGRTQRGYSLRSLDILIKRPFCPQR